MLTVVGKVTLVTISVSYCCITNYPKNQWLNIAITLFFASFLVGWVLANHDWAQVSGFSGLSRTQVVTHFVADWRVVLLFLLLILFLRPVD